MAAEGHVSEHDYSRPHRDDHYLMMVLTEGNFVINIDFEHIGLTAPAILLIQPGQVHHIVSAGKTFGWGISIDPTLIDLEIQGLLEKGLRKFLSFDFTSAFYVHAVNLLGQMEKLQADAGNQFHLRASHSLLDALLALLAAEVAGTESAAETKANRGMIISQAFMQLLKVNYKLQKQPSWYAARLNISVAHLYDTIKAATGESVSATIQQYCMLEAKRQLCFTSLTVREIGYELGYEEPVYFGKLFKKLTGFTPIQFRDQYRV